MSETEKPADTPNTSIPKIRDTKKSGKMVDSGTLKKILSPEDFSKEQKRRSIPDYKKRQEDGTFKDKRLHSIRQLIVVNKIKEALKKNDGKKITLRKLMRDAGYSISYTNSSTSLLKKKSFQTLLEEHLPNYKLTAVHDELLDAATLKSYTFSMSESDENIEEVVSAMNGAKLIRIVVFKTDNGLMKKRAYFQVPDNQIRQKAVSEGYKVKGLYPAEKHEHAVAVVNVTNYAKPKP